MITKNVSNKGQVQIVSLDQLVPEDHILRKIDRSVDFSFIYDLVGSWDWISLIRFLISALLERTTKGDSKTQIYSSRFSQTF